jgi:hypothetical protein
MIERMREDDHYIMLDIGVEIEEEVERELLEPLRALGIPAEIPPQGSGNPLEQLTGVISLANSTAALALLAAKQFNEWRHKRQAQPHAGPRRITRTLIISRHGRTPLDSGNTTDEEVIVYFSEEREE